VTAGEDAATAVGPSFEAFAVAGWIVGAGAAEMFRSDSAGPSAQGRTRCPASSGAGVDDDVLMVACAGIGTTGRSLCSPP
jgi:hypothetical protein